MELIPVLMEAQRRGASDIFIISGRPLCLKVNEHLVNIGDEKLLPNVSEALISEAYSMSNSRSMDPLTNHGDDDFSFSLSGIARFRVNAYKQRGSLAAVIRVVSFDLPDPVQIGIPDAVMSLSDRTKGLILVTGSSGSGKSTTLACMIDRINSTRSGHIITLENPIEYLHSHKESIVSQREIAIDTESYSVALRSALRQTPDVILIGELRDAENISTAMTAAETGHLIISTLHTIGAANTIDRIIDAFPPEQQSQIRMQLSMVLQAVVSQQLLPSTDGGVIPAFEVMVCNNAIRNMIREQKLHQIDSVIFSGSSEGMISMDASLYALFESGRIDAQTAVTYSASPELMSRKIKAR